MNLAPVILFVYDRLEHTRQTVVSLLANLPAAETEIFVFSDAAGNRGAEERVKAVREYISGIRGFKKISLYAHNENMGPSRSIVNGVSEIIGKYGRAIILEDDLLLSRYFLKFMNDALTFYENDEKVISVCGHTYPVRVKGQETFFLRIADCWGWGTWRRGWDLFEPDAGKLLKGLKSKGFFKRLDLEGAYGYSGMLKKQAANELSSWAVRWYASGILHEKLTLYPYRSLVRNIGFDDSGTNCKGISAHSAELFQQPITVSRIPEEEHNEAIRDIKGFFRMGRLNKIICQIKKIFKRGLPLC